MSNRSSIIKRATDKLDAVREVALPRRLSWGRLLFILLIIFLYVGVLFYNLNESDRRSLQLNQNGQVADGVHLMVEVISVDVAHKQIKARMQMRLSGNVAKDEFTPAVNLRFLANTVQGQQRYEFPRGERLIPIEGTFAMAGEQNMYPFDKYEAIFAFLATKPGQAVKPLPPASVAKPKDKSKVNKIYNEKDALALQMHYEKLVGITELAKYAPVPISLDMKASIPGFKFTGESVSSNTKEVTRIQLNLQRAQNVIVASIGIQLMMLMLALSILAMVMYGTIHGKESALIPLSISATLIFGLPALRDTQPGIPPLGAFSDYISYLWAEAIVVMCTIIAIWTWISRHRPKKTSSTAKKADAVTD
jgi:hypothetical protein